MKQHRSECTDMQGKSYWKAAILNPNSTDGRNEKIFLEPVKMLGSKWKPLIFSTFEGFVSESRECFCPFINPPR